MTHPTSLGPRRETADLDTNRRKQTRQRLIDAAFTVFGEHGLHAATVEQITEAAGFSRGAFYSNFSSKEELFFAAIDRKRDERIARASRQVDLFERGAGADPMTVDDLATFLIDSMVATLDDRGWLVAQLEALSGTFRDPALAARQFEIREREIRDVAVVLRLGLDRIGRRAIVDDIQAADIVLAVYDRVLTSVLLEGVSLDDFPARLAPPVAATVIGITVPIP